MAAKTTCARCSVHCYNPKMRRGIRVVMRYSGPRMFFYHPVMALRHLLIMRQGYGTKENYAKHQSIFLPYAYLTPDGEWHETGRMGWWGLDDATAESREKFLESFETFLEEAKAKNFLITIVDCHI